ncbi:MAG: hypothetical protein ACD_45C00097G0002 [uncultured bacterium]|nr:MAG: hypothetical protein ACD_45C00097G0002 [uncultured bacterium]OGT55950.1 MAG: hypothetical protein A3F43_02810 [Gammaproteobacteria bacterium RIFCSPHIGHO2_12_FULL_42_10]
MKMAVKRMWCALLVIVCVVISSIAFSQPIETIPHVKGIYLTQETLENTKLLNYLIARSKQAGVNTFVVDLIRPTKRYRDNIALVKDNNIHYVARIVMFDGGGTPTQIANPDIWQRQYAVVKQAVDLGASAIQLDYIRYSTKEPALNEHSQNIYKILSWYKTKLAQQNIQLQVDVFGITSRGEEKHIGQNVPLFAGTIDAICPMVYPSHFAPFDTHFAHPYDTVYDSLTMLQEQFDDHMPIKMYAYIELTNYHFEMTHAKTLAYITAQIKAVEDADADGWYAWSPHNRYDNLFYVLDNEQRT